MGSIISAIQNEGIECLQCEKVNLDVQMFNEYRESDEHPAKAVFECRQRNSHRIPIYNITGRSIFHYFLDGSRRTYKVADVIVEGHYLPLVAGQVGVAVMERDDDTGRVHPVRELCRFENVIAFPDKLPPEDIDHLQTCVNKVARVQFKLLSYEVKEKSEPVDLGIAKIMSHMHEMEVNAVQQMVDANMLANDRMLIKDGSLRYKKKLDTVQFRNVLGVSKTFRPSFTIGTGHKKIDVGAITSGLRFAERTSVYRSDEDYDKLIGMWYLRLRQPRWMSNPLQGIVKLECYAVDQNDCENGFDSERIDNLSAYLLRERNVTPYGTDTRWASHIYPIYLAETYIKNSFMSDICFVALF